MLQEQTGLPRIKACAAIFAGLVVAAVVAAAPGRASLPAPLLAQLSPNYVTWYNTASPWPSPITSAYVGVGGALGAGNLYNTATNGFGTPGTGVLGTNECAFLCYGAPGVASSNVLAVGNDVSSPNPYSFTTLGAPDDCSTRRCPGGISDQVFSIESYASPTSVPTVVVAIDAMANFATFSNIYAGAAVIAGAGTSNPVPSPEPGSLVSYTGASTGDILLGSSANYVKCDYGETTFGALTCNRPFVISGGGLRPNGSSGGYAPEAFPDGAATPNPQILNGSCAVTTPSTMCTFPHSRTFSGTSYDCTISAQGATALAASYLKNSGTQITIYSGTSATFSYSCM
jgi:hypothetical protein